MSFERGKRLLRLTAGCNPSGLPEQNFCLALPPHPLRSYRDRLLTGENNRLAHAYQIKYVTFKLPHRHTVRRDVEPFAEPRRSFPHGGYRDEPYVPELACLGAIHQAARAWRLPQFVNANVGAVSFLRHTYQNISHPPTFPLPRLVFCGRHLGDGYDSEYSSGSDVFGSEPGLGSGYLNNDAC